MPRKQDSALHIICLDEMNLARVEYYFAEFLSLLQLEEDMRKIHLLPRHVQKEVIAAWPDIGTSDFDAEQEMNALFAQDDERKRKLFMLGRYLDFDLPPNVRFVGTINMDDTTNDFSPKVSDRCYFLTLSEVKASENKQTPPCDDCFPLSYFSLSEESGEITGNPNRKRYSAYERKMLAMAKRINPHVDVNDIKKRIHEEKMPPKPEGNQTDPNATDTV